MVPVEDHRPNRRNVARRGAGTSPALSPLNGTTMRVLKQLFLCIAVLAGTGYLWLSYVPGAAAFLERTGVTDLLGIQVAAAEASEGGSGGFGPRGPVQVVVADVTEATTNDRVDAIGDLRAMRGATLRTEVSGEVVEVALETGGYVEADAVILRLDDEAERIALERAQLMLEDAEGDVTRLGQLQGTGAVTEVRLREARLAQRTAELAVTEAEFRLSQRTLRAPFAGWIGLLDASVGERLSPQDTVATLTDRSEVLIDFRAPERIVSLIEPGMEMEARFLGGGNAAPRTGEIHAVDNIVDPDSRTLRVQGKLPNDDDRLRAGMSFAVTLRFPGDTLVAVDPLSVQWASDGSYVWAVRDGKAERVGVTIRQRDSDRVIVESDLAPGEAVVTEGVQALRPGAEVAVTNPPEAGLAEKPSSRSSL